MPGNSGEQSTLFVQTEDAYASMTDRQLEEPAKILIFHHIEERWGWFSLYSAIENSISLRVYFDHPLQICHLCRIEQQNPVWTACGFYLTMGRTFCNESINSKTFSVT
eukprot:7506238-Ditylum_brightwellii.AAC.1